MNSIDKIKPRWYFIVNPKENKKSNQKRFNIRYDQKNKMIKKNQKSSVKNFNEKIKSKIKSTNFRLR